MIGLRTARAAFALHHRERKRRRASPEHELQRAVAAYLAVALLPPVFWTSIDAGAGKLSKASAGSAKARGVKAGLPDVWVFAPQYYAECGSKPMRVVAIELKSGKGRLSPTQQVMQADLIAAGVNCHVARSIDDVEMILERAGVPLRATAFAFSQKRARAA